MALARVGGDRWLYLVFGSFVTRAAW
jgi:hypothetical protein